MREQRATGNLSVGVLASGRGSNLQAIIETIEAGRLTARVTVVIRNKTDAQALERARRHGIPDVFVDPKPYAGQSDGREAYDRALLEVLGKHDVELVLLAGYMRIVTSVLIGAYPNRILNIHPALLPAFGGKGMFGERVHEAVLASDAEVSGATVHYADEEYDTGTIVGQWSVPVLPEDDASALAARVLVIEHLLYPAVADHVCKAWSAGRVPGLFTLSASELGAD